VIVRVTCGTAPFPPEARLPARIPSARATDRSSPSPIPTVMHGWSRRSLLGVAGAECHIRTTTGRTCMNDKYVRDRASSSEGHISREMGSSSSRRGWQHRCCHPISN